MTDQRSPNPTPDSQLDTEPDGKDLADHVAIVTGAGRGIGRSHALLLASLGASVVVNDLVPATADGVVEEIQAAGGRAMSSGHDISRPEDGRLLVDATLESFGRLDVLIHNAGLTPNAAEAHGIQGFASFADVDLEVLQKYIDVNVMSAYYVGQPAWAAMAARGYGRIVFTSSASIFGLYHASPYAMTKSAMAGLVATLALEARDDGVDIKTNGLVPAAATGQASGRGHRDQFGDRLDPINVASTLGYLASPKCEVSGQLIRAGGTFLGRVFIGMNQGWSSGGSQLTVRDAVENFDRAMTVDRFTTPTNTAEAYEWMYDVVSKAGPGGDAAS